MNKILYLIIIAAFMLGCATRKSTQSNTVKKIKSIENKDLNEKNLNTQESLIESSDLNEMNLNAQDSLKDYSLLVINPDIDMKDIEHYLKIIDPKNGFCMACNRTLQEIRIWGLSETTDEWKQKNLKDIQERLQGWQLESFKESYKNKVENGISLFKKELIK